LAFFYFEKGFYVWLNEANYFKNEVFKISASLFVRAKKKKFVGLSSFSKTLNAACKLFILEII